MVITRTIQDHFLAGKRGYVVYARLMDNQEGAEKIVYSLPLVGGCEVDCEVRREIR